MQMAVSRSGRRPRALHYLISYPDNTTLEATMFCWSCGSQIPDDAKFCTNCGQLQRAIKRQPSSAAKIENWMRLAKTAQLSGNYSQAYNYYSKVLESDGTNHAAWLGKGICAGWKSTYSSIRFQELFACALKAAELVPLDQSMNYKSLAGLEMKKIVDSLLQGAHKSFQSRITYHTHALLLERTFALSPYYWLAYALDPDPMILKAMIAVLANTLMCTYTSSSGKDKIDLSDHGYSRVKNIIKDAEKEIRRVEPSFRARIPAHDKDGSCYIATAVYRSYDAPEVVVLRAFRDRVLSRHLIGRVLISAYYQFSPWLVVTFYGSRFVRHSTMLILDVAVREIRPKLLFAEVDIEHTEVPGPSL